MRYSIIIPCYNEKENLKDLVERITPMTQQHDLEFILVENGSEDGSREYFKTSIEGKNAAVRVQYVDQNRGYGYGIQQGLKAAAGDFVGWIHADLQMRPEELTRFFDAAIKYRAEDRVFLKAHRTNRTAFELVFTYGQAAFTSVLFLRKMYDVAAVPCMFSKEFLNETAVENMPNDFSIDIYVYWQAVRLGYLVLRPVIEIQKRNKGASTWNRGFTSRIKQSRRIIHDSILIRLGKKVF